MRVLVVGGTGFIGPYVVRALVEQGHEVSVFHRGSSEAELPAGTGGRLRSTAAIAASGDCRRRALETHLDTALTPISVFARA